MREIVFRGVPKNKDYFFHIPPEYYKYHNASNLIFVYGSFLKQNEKTFICWYYKDVYRKAEVISETIGQYTGIKDCYGQSIFEGDILRSNNSEEWCEVFYEDYARMLIVFHNKKYHFNYTTEISRAKDKIENNFHLIGNVHEYEKYAKEE